MNLKEEEDKTKRNNLSSLSGVGVGLSVGLGLGLSIGLGVLRGLGEQTNKRQDKKPKTNRRNNEMN